MGDDLRAWAEGAGCAAVLQALAELGVENPGDILLLEESDIAALSADLRKIQATKFGLALEALRGGAPAAVPPVDTVPATAVEGAGQLLIPDYLVDQPKDTVSVFTELRDQSARRRRVVHLAGKELPLVIVAGVTGALALLFIIAVIVIVVNGTHDSCVNVHCGTYGSCQSGACVCQPGYSGTPCAVDICYQVNCGAHGSCYVSNDAGTEHACRCAGGWKGRQCDQVDPCYQRCGVHGTCADHGTTATCTCAGEYTGDRCQLDPCHGADCGVGVCQGAKGLACKHTCHVHT